MERPPDRWMQDGEQLTLSVQVEGMEEGEIHCAGARAHEAPTVHVESFKGPGPHRIAAPLRMESPLRLYAIAPPPPGGAPMEGGAPMPEGWREEVPRPPVENTLTGWPDSIRLDGEDLSFTLTTGEIPPWLAQDLQHHPVVP